MQLERAYKKSNCKCANKRSRETKLHGTRLQLRRVRLEISGHSRRGPLIKILTHQHVAMEQRESLNVATLRRRLLVFPDPPSPTAIHAHGACVPIYLQLATDFHFLPLSCGRCGIYSRLNYERLVIVILRFCCYSIYPLNCVIKNRTYCIIYIYVFFF